jgi:uncharacterized membrane protein
MTVLASSTVDTIGILVTFLGIGVVANVIIVYVVALVLGEKRQNDEYRAKRPTTSQ